MKKILIVYFILYSIAIAGTYSYTRMSTATGIIEPALDSTMEEIDENINKVLELHTPESYEESIVKNNEIKKILKLETLILLELRRSSDLDEKIEYGEAYESK